MMPAQKHKVPLAGGTLQETNKNDSRQIVADRLADLQFMLARKGHELHRLRDGTFLVCRWGLSRELRTLADVEEFLRTIGGAHEL